jgi:hypothetical protein
MISIQKKFLFIHVPKTAGNSVQRFLVDFSEDEILANERYHDGSNRFGIYNSSYKFKKHSTLSHYKSILPTHVYKSLFKFATIRNPWDKLISFYFSPHRGETHFDRDKFLLIIHQMPTLRSYIFERSLLERGLMKFGFKPPIGYLNPAPLGWYIDFLIRFESLERDLEVVCETLNIPFSPLQKSNTSERAHYSEYYDDELQEIVRRKFSEEITYGNYEFEQK